MINKFGYPTPDAAAGGRSLKRRNGRNYGRTDTTLYRDVWPHLKMIKAAILHENYKLIPAVVSGN